MIAKQGFGWIAVLGLAAATLSACGGGLSPPHTQTVMAGGARPAPMSAMMTGAPANSAPDLAVDRENYAHTDENPVKLVAQEPVSTFSADVDTASYSNVRRILNEARLPPHDSVRVEEMVNYFGYDYPAPQKLDPPFSIFTEMAPAPWNTGNVLLQIGLQGYKVNHSDMPAANLVFLVDVSGSMDSSDKLGLLKYALKELTSQLTARDRVSIVVYAGASGLLLEPTPGNQRERIDAALEGMQAGGSTNGGEGIRLAYATARASFIKGGINRIILATDGDFNVGTTDFQALINLVEQQRKSGISLTTLGFGAGNLNDRNMEQLADHGNGNYAYLDTPSEARKVLVEQIGSNLLTIARDVKLQIEFNPAVVSEYRLIGYENRLLNREDFNNDKVDAGEMGAGHAVTAFYELTLKGGKGLVDPLRYNMDTKPAAGKAGELAFLRLRYKKPDSDTSTLIEQPVPHSDIRPSVDKAGARFRFAASVAAFAQLLRGETHTGSYSFKDIGNLARTSLGGDEGGYRHEFLRLVQIAESLSPKPVAAPAAAKP